MDIPGNTDIAKALQLSTGIIDPTKLHELFSLRMGLETSGSLADEIVKIAGGNVTIDVVSWREYHQKM